MIDPHVFDTVLVALKQRLGTAGLRHSVDTAELAQSMASVYGVDPEVARVAALAHDWARDLGPDVLLDEAEARGITITSVDRTVPYLLHAPVGAELFAEEFPELPTEIANAIRTHTVGAVAMSDLDMVVYLADMLEPERAFPGVQALRDAIGNVALEELYRRAYAWSVTHIVDARRHLHPATVEVWNASIAGERS